MKVGSKWLMGLFFAMGVSAAVQASTVGNGGDVVYCPNISSPKKVELLDYYEGKTYRGFKIDLSPYGKTHQQKVSYITDRLSKIDASSSEEITAAVNMFYQQAVFLPNVELNDIPDSDHIAVPAGCEIRQVAIQMDPQLPGDHAFTVSKDIWDIMGENDKAGLVLHEAIYWLARKKDHKNSIWTRYLNAYFSSQDFPGDPKAYRKIITDAQVFENPSVLVNGYILYIKTLKLYGHGDHDDLGGKLASKNAVIKFGKNSLEAIRGSWLAFSPQDKLHRMMVKLAQPTTLHIGNQKLPLKPVSNIETIVQLHEDGSVAKLRHGAVFEFKAYDKTLLYQGEYINFFPNGDVQSFSHVAPFEWVVAGGRSVKFSGDLIDQTAPTAEFFSNGMIKYGRLLVDAKLLTKGGEVEVPGGEMVHFDENGFLVK